MDTIKYHGSSETQIITRRSILIRMRFCTRYTCNNFHMYACIVFYSRFSRLFMFRVNRVLSL